MVNQIVIMPCVAYSLGNATDDQPGVCQYGGAAVAQSV